MSGAASEAIDGGASRKNLKKLDGEAIAAAAEPAGPEPMVESETDRHETILVYDPSAKMPLAVILVWVCALIGLGTYTVTLLFPDLALWGKP
jgi:hypothetical protein